jgi:ribosome-binding ATPase YchF (GTP1/OBG family)
VRVGLVGFEGSGKTTLFRALSGGKSAGTEHQVAAVSLAEDERLAFLVDLHQPKKSTPASVTLNDYPGIPAPGSAEGKTGLTGVRDEVEGLVLVVRGFSTDAYFHARPEPDPAADARDLALELLLDDLAVATRRIEKLAKSVTKPTPKQEEEKRELSILERIREGLEAEVPVKSMDLSSDEERVVRGFGFLTSMPWLLFVSLPDEGGDEDLAVPGPFDAVCSVRVKLEADLLDLEPEDRAEFLEDLAVTELRLPGFPEEMMDALGRIRFYTASDREVRVWEVPRDTDVVTAAGKIHTDMARGFIRAEVVAFEDLQTAGDERGAKAAGTYRVEGKDYVVKDGDVIYVRFSV